MVKSEYERAPKDTVFPFTLTRYFLSILLDLAGSSLATMISLFSLGFRSVLISAVLQFLHVKIEGFLSVGALCYSVYI